MKRNKTLNSIFVAMLSAAVAGPSTLALAAQDTTAPTAPTAPTETAPSAPAETATSPAEVPTGSNEAAPAAATTEQRLVELESKVEGMTESASATNATVDALKRIKFSGYLQGRYEWHDDADSGVDAAGKPLGTNRFSVRRGRVKLTYVGDMSEFVLSTDATPDGVVVKDAEASLVLDETIFPSSEPWQVKLTLGQFNMPFGYEVSQSSSDREMPERSGVIRALFPGERDRGFRVMGQYKVLRLAAALTNGTFTNDALYGTRDHSGWKDFIGRVGVDLDFLSIGVSGHFGRYHVTTPGAAASGATAAKLPVSDRFSRMRLGADVQFYYDVPHLGGFALKSEVIISRDEQMESEGVQPKDGCKGKNGMGFYVTATQNFSQYLGAVVRYDSWDATSSAADNCVDEKLKKAWDIDKVTVLGGGPLVHFSGNLKLALIYEHRTEQGGAKAQGGREIDDDVFTAQLQAKF